MLDPNQDLQMTAAGDAALRRYIAALPQGRITAEAAVDGADCGDLYAAAATWSARLIGQFGTDGEAPVAAIVDSLTDIVVEHAELDTASAELLVAFAHLTANGGTWDDPRAETYIAAAASDPDLVASIALLYTATLAHIVADATDVDTDTTLDLLAA
jgi:hypothetical protein